MLDVDQLLTEARIWLDDPAKSVFDDDGMLVRSMSAFQRTLYQTARRLGENLLVLRHSVPFASFTNPYPTDATRWLAVLPYRLRSTVAVLRTDTTRPERILDRRQPGGMTRITRDDDHDEVVGVSAFRYEIKGSEVWIYGTIPSSFVCEIEYEQQPPDLLTFTATATGATTTNIPIKAAVNGDLRRVANYYAGAYVVSTTSGANLGLPVRITAHAGLALTVDALALAPVEDETFALVPAIPPEFHSLLSQGGAYLAAVGKRQFKILQSLDAVVRRGIADFTSTIEARQSDAPRHVNETNEMVF